MEVCFEAVREARPGPKWRRLFRRFWPAYRRWCYGDRDHPRPARVVAEQRLRQAMPELLPTYRRLVDLTGDDPDVARFLTLYRPPPYLAACSQAVWTRGRPALVRNYDYSPELWEGVLLHTRWNDRRVMAMSDCLWGVLDGVNDAGLVVSLAFGGHRGVGDGFGCPLILRYLLEVCDDAADARRVLRRVVPHMAYNVTVLDASAAYFTAELAPDRPPEIRRRRLATNHQSGRGRTRYTTATSSVEREQLLEGRLADRGADFGALAGSFLEPPLYNTRHDLAMGTLYTAVYDPVERSVELRWPDRTLRRKLAGFREESHRVRFA